MTNVPGIPPAKASTVQLTDHLPDERRQHVDARLRSNLIAWFTTVREDGQPTSVPVWFLVRDEGTILIYTEPGARKLRTLLARPKVSLGLDVTDIGRDNIRVEGEARAAPEEPAARHNPAYLAKYTERIGAMFGSPEAFSATFSVPLVITPSRVRA